MSQNYDNWERLVAAVLRREHDREIAMAHSTDSSSISSTSSSFSSTSQLDRPRRSMDYSYLTTIDHSVWKTMLPPDEQEIVWRSASLSFFVDQNTGKNCFLLGATRLQLSCKAGNKHWKMKPHEKSRFLEVAVLLDSSLSCIQVSIKTKMMSPKTLYAAYLVFGYEGKYPKPETLISLINIHSWKPARVLQFEAGNVRADEWMEIRLGNFYVGMGDNRKVDMRLMKNIYILEKRSIEGVSIIVEGIEFRPLKGKKKTREKEYFQT